MNVEIITIGDEILIGQIVDANSAWMAQQLNIMGASVVQITSVSDERSHIIEAIDNAKKRADVILITGGLGPTKDDITKKTLCEYFCTDMVFNEDVYKDVEKLFAARGLGVSDINRKQAEVPRTCKVIRNEYGTAPAMWFDDGEKVIISMPGVPYEMKHVMQKKILPALMKQYKMDAIVHKTVLTQGIGESYLSELISDWENKLRNQGLKLAYLPKPGIVRLRVSAKGSDKTLLIRAVDDTIDELRNIIPQYIYGIEAFGEEKFELQHIIGDLLIKNKKTLATAESCTGGHIAHLITSVPGSSAYFNGAVVSYTNDVKINTLGVDVAALTNYGAVSEEVVTQMAIGVKSVLKTDYAIATSGIAGPSGGTLHIPVGTTWIALAYEGGVIVEKFMFGENRGRNIQKASLAALAMLRKKMVE